MLLNVENWMETAHRWYQGRQDRRICNASEKIEAGQYVYVNQPPMVTPATQRLAPNLYSNLMSVEIGLFRVIEVSLAKVVVQEDGIRNSGPVNCATVALAGMETRKDKQPERQIAKREICGREANLLMYITPYAVLQWRQCISRT